MLDTREFRYVVDASDCIVSANGHWFDFAKENGAPHLNADTLPGKAIWDFIEGLETRQLYRVLFKTVRERGDAKVIPYRCDAPDRRRYMELTISHAGEGNILFRSRIMREEMRECVALLQAYALRNDYLIVMCSWCNKVRVRGVDWVEVEDAVKELNLFEATQLPRITHGICDRCAMAVEAFGI